MLRFQITLPRDQPKSKPFLHRPCKSPGKLQHVQVLLAEKPILSPNSWAGLSGKIVLPPNQNILGILLNVQKRPANTLKKQHLQIALAKIPAKFIIVFCRENLAIFCILRLPLQNNRSWEQKALKTQILKSAFPNQNLNSKLNNTL